MNPEIQNEIITEIFKTRPDIDDRRITVHGTSIRIIADDHMLIITQHAERGIEVVIGNDDSAFAVAPWAGMTEPNIPTMIAEIVSANIRKIGAAS